MNKRKLALAVRAHVQNCTHPDPYQGVGGSNVWWCPDCGAYTVLSQGSSPMLSFSPWRSPHIYIPASTWTRAKFWIRTWPNRIRWRLTYWLWDLDLKPLLVVMSLGLVSWCCWGASHGHWSMLFWALYPLAEMCNTGLPDADKFRLFEV